MLRLRSATFMLMVLGTFAAGSRGHAAAHPEIVVGCDAKSNLVAKFDNAAPFPLAASRFTGIDGYADAIPGFSSAGIAEPDQNFFPLDPQANIAFLLEGADPGAGVWNDHGSGLLRPGELFKLGNPFFDSHPVWNITKGEPGKRYALRLKVRDLSGRYHDSAAFIPLFAIDSAKELYACPMLCQPGVTFNHPARCPVCGMTLKLLSGRNYQVKVTPERIGSGQDTLLRFEILSPDGKPVTDLEIVHEKLLHLLIVSKDLSWFAHQHPQLQPDGSFSLKLNFPHGGEFTLYHDFTPARIGMQVVPVTISVQGNAPPDQLLVVSRNEPQSAGHGYTVEWVGGPPFTSLQTQSLRFKVKHNGEPVTDLEPYLGALGHLIVISQDRKHFVHSHPLPPQKQSAAAKKGAAAATGADAGQTGPEVVFNALFPAPSLYKAWAQFQHRGQVLTVPFIFQVLSPANKPNVPAVTPLSTNPTRRT